MTYHHHLPTCHNVQLHQLAQLASAGLSLPLIISYALVPAAWERGLIPAPRALSGALAEAAQLSRKQLGCQYNRCAAEAHAVHTRLHDLVCSAAIRQAVNIQVLDF